MLHALQFKVCCNANSVKRPGGIVARSRIQTWLVVIAVAVGLIPVAILGLWGM